MALESKNTTVRVEWECDRGPKVTVVFVPLEKIHEYNDRRSITDGDPVAEYLSNTFGYLVKHWEIVK